MKFALLAGLVGMAFCGDNDIQGPDNKVISGKDNHIRGKANTVDGWRNVVQGNFNDIDGDQNQVKGNSNHVDGLGNLVIGSGNIVMGQGNVVNDNMNVQINMDWSKNLKTDYSSNNLNTDQLMNEMQARMSQQMLNGKFEQDFGQKMRKQMELRLNGQGNMNHHSLQRLRQLSREGRIQF